MRREALVFGILLALVLSPVVVEAKKSDPVLFVHGFTGSASNWDVMIARLIADGWSSSKLFAYTFSNPYDASDGANVRNAYEVKSWVDNILKRTGASKVNIVAHSMGGLSTRYYIKFLGGVNVVDHYIALGTPQKGTILAFYGDMRPGSPFLRTLNSGDETPGYVKYTTICSPIDELVQPLSYCQLNGADNRIVYSGHITLLTSTSAYNIVKNKLAS